MILRYIKNNFVPGIFLILIISGFKSNAQLVDKIIVKVDNQVILKSDLDISYLQFLANDDKAEDSEDSKCHVLESLIINKLLLAKAEIDSVVVERETVEDQLSRRMSFFINKIGSEQKLEEFYGKSIDDLKSDLRKQVREQLILQKMQDNITSSIKVTPAEVKKFFNSIPKDSLPYFSTEVEVGQIVKVPKVGKEEKNAAKAKLEKIRERIQKGEDFCKLAKDFSEDPGSAKHCGELGFFRKGDLVPEYEAAALRLKPGEFSSLVESEYGFHLIQLVERRGNEYNTRHILIKPVSSSKDLTSASTFLDSLRSLILKDSISFEKAARKYSDDKGTAGTGGLFLDMHSGSSRIALEDLDPGIFFIIDTMKVGQISRPMSFRMEDGTEAIRIIYYKTKIPPHKANLKDDYQKIQMAALMEKRNNAINEWFDKTKGSIFINIDEEYKNCEILITQ